MKELMNKFKNTKGISIITLSVAVTILIIITGTLIYNAKDTIEIRNLKNMYNDIELLDDKVEEYYTKFGAIPGNKEYNVNLNFLKGPDGIDNTEDDVQNNSGNYYIIDLASLDGVTSLNYGRDYGKATITSNDTDIYIINQVSHQIYYVKGVESEEKTYYTNEQKIQDDVDMKITVIDSIEDLVRFEQKVNGTYPENDLHKTFAGENVVLTRDLDFEDDTSYDGSTVTIGGTSYSLNGTNNLKTYLCKDENNTSKTTGWTPIGTDNSTNNTTLLYFNGEFNGQNYTISNIYINDTTSGNIGQALFAYIGENGIVKNLTISGKINGARHVAGIAGRCHGKIENCINLCNVSQVGSVSQTGGIAGITSESANIYKCKNKGSILCEGSQVGRNSGIQF